MRVLFKVAGLCVICAGCARIDAELRPVEAENVAAFSAWQRKAARQITPAQLRQFDAAIQEIRYGIMGQHEATGHDAIEVALCGRINGRKLKEVLLIGDALKLQRLETEQVKLQEMVNANAYLMTKPGDRVAATTLEQIRSQQQRRLDTLQTEIQETRKRILANGGVISSEAADATATAPSETISADEARQQIATMVEKRRGAGVMKYGAWPVKIDREGRQLDEAMRGGFAARKATAESTGEVVIPIKIKGRWLLFEGPNQAPQLPKLVRSILTEAELRKFQDDWVNAEAERWAREASADFEIPNSSVEPATLPPLLPGARGR